MQVQALGGRLALGALAPVTREPHVRVVERRRLHEAVAGLVADLRADERLDARDELVRVQIARERPPLVEPRARLAELAGDVVDVAEVRDAEPRGLPRLDQVDRRMPL